MMLMFIPEVTEDDQWDNVWVSSVTKKSQGIWINQLKKSPPHKVEMIVSWIIWLLLDISQSQNEK